MISAAEARDIALELLERARHQGAVRGEAERVLAFTTVAHEYRELANDLERNGR